MRVYGQIQSAFWQAPDIAGTDDTPSITDGAKLLACFLLTGPQSNGIGCYPLGNGVVTDVLRWSIETIEERFDELSANGFAYRSNGVVFIPNFLRWNGIANANVAKARFKEWESLPRGIAKALAAGALLEFCSYWTEAQANLLQTVCQTVSDTQKRELKTRKGKEPNRKEPNQKELAIARLSEIDKPERADDVTPSPRKRVVAPAKSRSEPDAFAAFWSLYPRKVARPKAAQSFGKLTEAEQRAAIEAIPKFAASWKWRTEPDYIPHPTTWLNQRRWEDDPPPAHPSAPAARQPHAPKQSRQNAIFEVLANDHRYAETAARLAAGQPPQGLLAAHPAESGLHARAGHGSNDADCLDADFSEQGHR